MRLLTFDWWKLGENGEYSRLGEIAIPAEDICCVQVYDDRKIEDACLVNISFEHAGRFDSFVTPEDYNSVMSRIKEACK